MKRIGIGFWFICVLGYSQQFKHSFGVSTGPLLCRANNYYTSQIFNTLKLPITGGYGLNVKYEYSFWEKMSLSTGLGYMYTSRAIRVENSSDAIIYTKSSVTQKTLRLNSIFIPLDLNYIVSINKDCKLYPSVGLSIQKHLAGAYVENSKVTQLYELLPSQNNVVETTKSGDILFEQMPDSPNPDLVYHKSVNWNVDLGIGVSYKKYFLELKYMYGLFNQYSLPKNEQSKLDTDRYSTSTFSLMFGYKFFQKP